jgi:hypothetical protein
VHEVAHFCRSVKRACGGGPVRWFGGRGPFDHAGEVDSANSPRRETAAPAGALTKGCSRKSRALLQSTPEATAHSSKDKRDDEQDHRHEKDYLGQSNRRSGYTTEAE